jgi:hypothetical protein
VRWSNKKHKIKKHKPTASSPAGFNRFTYANNNPLSGKDIDGNKWIPYGRFSGQSISPNRVDVLNNIYENEAGIMRQEEKLKRAMALIDAEWRDFVTGGTPVIYVDGIKLSDTEADKLSQMGLSGLAWMFNASTIESYGITSTGSGSWINPAEMFSNATSAGVWVRWDLAESSEGNGSYTSTYVHPVTGQVATYTDNMPSVYVIESFVPAMDFGTGSLALGGGIGQGGGGVDWSDIGNTLTAGGVAYYILEASINNGKYWVDAKGNIRPTKLLEKGENGKYVRGVQGLRNSRAAAVRAASKYAIAGKVVGGLGMFVTGYQFFDGQITGTEASVDLIMGGIGFTGWGTPISLMYFVGKSLYEYSTGNTLFEKPGGH